MILHQKSFALLFLLILATSSAFAQLIRFQKTIGGFRNEETYRLRITSDGGFIIVGTTTSSGEGLTDIYLVKTDSDGNVQWVKTHGGTGKDWGRYVEQTSDGGYIITGFTESFGAGSQDVILLKTDSTGDFMWAKTFGGPNFERGYCVRETPEGDYLIAGFTESFGAGSSDAYVIKCNSVGDSIWTKTFGGITFDQVLYAEFTYDGKYIFSGRTNSFGAGQTDVYLIKTDTSGTILWQKTYGDYDWEEGYTVMETPDTNYIIHGRTVSNTAGGSDVYLLKVDRYGTALWAKSYGGAEWEASFDMDITQDGGYILCGYTESFGPLLSDEPNVNGPEGSDSSQMWLIRTDINGDTLWSRQYGGFLKDEGFAVRALSDGGFIAMGIERSFGVDSFDCHLVRTDSMGISGCHEKRTHPIVKNAIVIDSISATIINTGNTIGNAAYTSGSPNFKDSTLCSDSLPVTVPNYSSLEPSINIFPNPFSHSATVQISLEQNISEDIQVRIYDIFGRKVQEFTADGHTGYIEFELKRTNLYKGLFLLNISTNGAIIAATKVLVN
ncbi:MAG: T9SS type A sorting domain-containing protein [Bacteroidetes bacterium]|nr:T9SS type A sorting domain-containing protein [Bacteroidota bacterium]